MTSIGNGEPKEKEKVTNVNLISFVWPARLMLMLSDKRPGQHLHVAKWREVHFNRWPVRLGAKLAERTQTQTVGQTDRHCPGLAASIDAERVWLEACKFGSELASFAPTEPSHQYNHGGQRISDNNNNDDDQNQDLDVRPTNENK